jgi:catechol 2,3-dioxygenase-like lactoylglutathione lyase family enzyme
MPETALGRIRGLDYTVIYVRDMDAMRAFYGEVMDFPLERLLGEDWVEYRVATNSLALANRRVTAAAHEAPAPPGAAALQLAFRVAPGEVDHCADELRAQEIEITGEPADQPWGHRTLFFRDPDGNVLEIYADI